MPHWLSLPTEMGSKGHLAVGVGPALSSWGPFGNLCLKHHRQKVVNSSISLFERHCDHVCEMSILVPHLAAALLTLEASI